MGDVLNHIFEVRRFLARGGMGEVFEGININTDERVAIKVMLPALAADPNVIAHVPQGGAHADASSTMRASSPIACWRRSRSWACSISSPSSSTG